MRSNKGSVTLFVLVAMIFFLALAISCYAFAMRNLQGQESEFSQIASGYSQDLSDERLEEIYQSLMNIEDVVCVGDYVAYTPISSTYTLSKDYSGYTSDQSYRTEDLGWRVLNINENGTVDLISAKPTTVSVYFQGANGYNNGVYLLNEMCSTLYSNSSKGATARSLNIEDIQDKIADEATYASYVGGVQYGKTASYASPRNYYPVQWKNDNGMVGGSESRNLISASNATYEQASGLLTVTQTYWRQPESTMRTAFKEAKVQTSEIDANIYYQLLCNNGSSNHWLASRYVNTYSDRASCDFGLHCIINGDVGGNNLFNSTNDNYNYSRYICPVVSVPSSIIDVTVGDGANAETAWGIK